MQMMTAASGVVLAVALGGCSLFMNSVEKPTATVRDVSLSSAGLAGASGQLALDVSNPNAFGVPLSGIDWELAVGGARAITGSVELSQTIPARGVAPVTTSLSISTLDAAIAAAALASGARDYHLTAHLHFTSTLGPIDVTLDHRGLLSDGGAARGLFGF